METIEQRLETARLRLQQKQPRTAVKLLRGILRDEPNHIESLALLAQLALADNKYDSARDLLQNAIKLRPGNATLRMNLGIAYHGLGQLDEAIAEFHSALKFRAKDGLIHFHLANALAAKGQLNEAGHSYQRAIHLRPKFIPAHYKFADVLTQAGAVNAAVVEYQKVLELDPRRDDAYVDLGSVLRRCDNDEQAINCFRKALQLNPRSVGAMNNLANTLRDRGQAEEGVTLLRRAIEISPNNPILHNSLGLALEKCSQFEEAFACFRKSLELNPKYANAHYNLGGLHQEFGDFQLAEAKYQDAIACNPNKAEAHYRLASLWLLRGDFTRAWPEYDYRWKMDEARGTVRKFDKPAWDGGPLDGKTILIHAEQGLGDTLQFVRYAELVTQRGATVILECPRKLVPLMGTCRGIDQVVAYGDPNPPDFDVQAPLLSLPGFMGTTLETIPKDVPYLDADPGKIEEWRLRLENFAGIRVGIAWQGKTSYLRDKMRSIPLAQFAGLAALPGVHLISLQKGIGRDQLKDLGPGCNIVDLAPELDNGPAAFEDTAAVMKNLDLVITSDTSIAHLAGGLAVPVWIALGYVPEWRWLLDREDSPWYPTMRLFRQPTMFDWQSAFTDMERALWDLVLKSREQASSAGA